MTVEQGEVWLADLNPTREYEQGDDRNECTTSTTATRYFR